MEVAPDALPYFDEGYEDPGVRAAVRLVWLTRWTHVRQAMALVQEEMSRYHPPASKYTSALPELPELSFAVSIVQGGRSAHGLQGDSAVNAELARLEKAKKNKPLDQSRCGMFEHHRP